MEPDSTLTTSPQVSQPQADPTTGELPLAQRDRDGGLPSRHRWPRRPWIVALVVALTAAGLVLAIAQPFSSGSTGTHGVASSSNGTGIYTVIREDLSSQTEVSATLGYTGATDIAVPAGASSQAVAQAQESVSQDQETLLADEQTDSDTTSADGGQVATAQAQVGAAQSTLSSDQSAAMEVCGGSGTSTTACSSATAKIGQDQTQLSAAQEQLQSAQAAATLGHDQAQAKVQSDATKLQYDQAALALVQATAINSGTTFTWLPKVGDIISEDQRVCSIDNEDVPLVYGSIPAYRAFSVGMSDGADVGELTQDLIALGFGAGLTQGNHYSPATAAAVERWQGALGLPKTGEVLLGQVVFEPGPIRVTSVVPSLGQSVGGGGGGGGAGGGGASGGGGGSSVLTATSITRQVSIALDASDQSEVAVGDKVSITLPDDKTTPGVVSSVGTVATSSSGNAGNTGSSSGGGSSGSSSPTITVLVDPTNPDATGTWDQAAVDVTITTGVAKNALVVPVDALLAQSGGSYAVEVVGSNGVHRLVAVDLGLFDDAAGLVQITGSTLTTGQRVVVPRL